MIYHLIEYLKHIGVDLPGQGLFSYLSFRAIISFMYAHHAGTVGIQRNVAHAG